MTNTGNDLLTIAKMGQEIIRLEKKLRRGVRFADQVKIMKKIAELKESMEKGK